MKRYMFSNFKLNLFNKVLRDLLILTSFFGTLFFIYALNRPLQVPDGGRYAEIAREMITMGDYITPHINGIKYFEKPPLFYWLLSLSMKMGGVNLSSVNSVNSILGILGCLITYLFTMRLFDRKTALLAAFILGTNLLYFAMLNIVNLDLSLTVFLTTSILAIFLALKTQSPREQFFYYMLASIAGALATLTKGPIGIILPAAIIFIWICVFNAWQKINKIYMLIATIVFLVITLPWHILVQMKNPEFFHFYIVDQHLLRYATKSIGHVEPIWFFIPFLIAGFFPWTFFLPQTILASIPKSWSTRFSFQNEIFLLIWAGFIFTFFSFSQSKLISYILPIFPALSILTAHFLVKSNRIQNGLVGFIISSIFISVAFNDVLSFSKVPNPVEAQHYLSFASLILLIGSFFILCSWKSSNKLALTVLIVTQSLFMLTLLKAIPSLDGNTIQPLTTILKPIITPQDEIVTFKQYYQDLPFYLERRVKIVDWSNELTFGMKHETPDHLTAILTADLFWQRWHSQKRLFAIMRLNEFELAKKNHPDEHFFILGKTLKNILVSNHPSVG